MIWPDRVTNKAVVLPAVNSSSKPIYIPAYMTSVLLFVSSETLCIICLLITIIVAVSMALLSCIVEQTYGVLMVWSQIYFENMIGWLIHPLSSTHIWSRPLPRWKSAQIFNPEPLHLLPFQCRTSYLSRTTGIHNFVQHIPDTQNLFFFLFLSLPITRPPTSLFVYCNSSLGLL